VQIAGVEFTIISNWTPLTVPDSFVVRDNKIESGHGEAKYYVGGRSDPNLRIFFGDEGFSFKAILIRDEVIQFLEDAKYEYLKPTQAYLNARGLPRLWTERMQKITMFQTEHIIFECDEQVAGGVRCYIKGSKNSSFELLRELSLPNRTTILIEKYGSDDGEECFVFRLRCFSGPPEQRELLDNALVNEINQDVDLPVKAREQLALSRVGQGKYRELLFSSCGAQCPFTGIKDDRLLTAIHIKPWSQSNNEERLNPQNGLVLSPVYGRLFDRGLITFTEDGQVVASKSLTPLMMGDLEIPESPQFHLPLFGKENAGRRIFLEYHRRNIFNP